MTEPLRQIGSEAERHKTRMLAAILVLTVPLALAALSLRLWLEPDYLPQFKFMTVCIGIMALPYWLARLGRWRSGTYLYLLISQALITISMVTDTTSNARFHTSLIVVLAAALLLEVKDTAIIALLNTLGLVAIALISEPTTSVHVYNSTAFLVFTSAIVLLTQHHRDRLEHTRAQETARRTATRRQLLEATFDGIAILEEGIIQESNEGMCSLLGYRLDEVLHKRLSSFMSEEFRETTEAALNSPDQCIRELVARQSDRRPIYLEVLIEPLPDSSPPRHLIALRNTTNRKQLQARLQIADRMAAIGSLAAGVAHEINNPLTYVLANLQEAANQISTLSRSDDQPGTALDRANQCILTATDGANRVQRTVRDLNTLARADNQPVSPINVQSVLDSTVGIALNTVRHRASLTSAHEHTRAAIANESRLGQVFLNLIMNASEALPEDQGSRKEIHISSYEDGDQVVIEIQDTGSGIPTEELDRIFDPYFTTKPVGVGTGLGLWVSRNLLHTMNGEIEVESTLGHGSTFRVKLQATDEQPKIAPAESPGLPGPHSGARILIVDDEEAIVELLEEVLKASHRVTGTTGGKQALEEIRANHFDVVICDLMMPDLSGMDVYEEVTREMGAQAPRFVFLTGGAVTNRSRAFVENTTHTVILKPFRPIQVQNAVQETLGHA